MTDTYKELLLEYLTGDLTNDYSTNSAYYKKVDTRSVDSSTTQVGTGTIAIECKDGNGVSNGKTLLYTPTQKTLVLLDENLNVLKIYDSWYTGTLFDEILAIDVDEEGQFYGIDYDAVNDKYRFILINNLSEPVKMPNGTYEYRAVLRQSYFINNYTVEDDITPNQPVYLAKSKQSATYYFAFCDSIGETILPTKLTINVGASNDWERLEDILVMQSIKLDHIIYFDNNDNPIATYFVRNDNTENLEKISVKGNQQPTTTTVIEWNDIENAVSGYENPSIDLKAINDNEYYLAIMGYKTDTIATITYFQQILKVYKDGLSNMIGNATISAPYISGNKRNITTEMSLSKTNDLSLFYWGAYGTNITKDKLYYNFFPYDTNGNDYLYNIYGTSANTLKNENVYVNFPGILITQYNLNKAMYITPDENNLFNYTTVSFIYNKDNYNCISFEKRDGEEVKTLLPRQGVIYDGSGEDVIFARNLYNFKTYKNKNTSILNIPSSYLNDTTLNSNALISFYNNSIVKNEEPITKNIYEDLYINYLNTITMQNRNTENYIDNLEGAIRLNQSTCKEFDYDNQKATKLKINYSDGTFIIGGATHTITDHVATYDLYIINPSDKNVTSLEIISEDEKTTYQKIQMPTLKPNTTYRIKQDVYVE